MTKKIKTAGSGPYFYDCCLIFLMSCTSDQYAYQDSCYSPYYHTGSECFCFLLPFVFGLLYLPVPFVPVHSTVIPVSVDPSVIILVHTVVLGLALAVVIIIVSPAVIVAIIP